MASSGARHAICYLLTCRPYRPYDSSMSYTLKTSQVAKQLSVSERTVRRWADKQIIKTKVLPSGHRRFDETEINKLKG